jgi:hypothetical protein
MRALSLATSSSSGVRSSPVTLAPRTAAVTATDDVPVPGAVPLDVNAKYPAGEPYPTTPAVVLAVLPALPTGLQYRIIGKDLILLDQPADVILDYVRNVIP